MHTPTTCSSVNGGVEQTAISIFIPKKSIFDQSDSITVKETNVMKASFLQLICLVVSIKGKSIGKKLYDHNIKPMVVPTKVNLDGHHKESVQLTKMAYSTNERRHGIEKRSFDKVSNVRSFIWRAHHGFGD